MKKNRFWLLILILIAFALRLTLLGKQSLWYDEGVTWMLSQMQLPDLINWTAADIQPPLYYLLIWATEIIFDDSEWALRFPSAIFNVLTVPLIYTLARRLFSPSPLLPRSSAPLLAAALFTVSPVMVYYSQEARMYTMLIFEVILAAYLLLKILHPHHLFNYQLPITNYQLPYSLLPISYSLLFALTAAAALYTHYFAAFLLTAHALYALLILWRQCFPKALLKHLLVGFGGTLLLFAPWLPTLLARLGDDPSYWPGTIKLSEALRKLLISFTAGETVLEQTGWWLALVYFGFWILDFGLLLGRQFLYQNRSKQPQINNKQQETKDENITHHASRITGHASLFLLLWLVLPILLLLALTYQSPKFNPRYTLLAWPAFALILATSIASLLNRPDTSRITRHASRITHHVSSALFTLSLLFILATAAFSLTNWFTDPRFSKDDFKALAQFVRERKARDETVLLSSGHLFPVWAYYYGWDGWTPLPWMLRLDVNQVTNLSIATDIAEAVAGQEGVWLVTWQNEVIDPNGVVPFWLDLIGHRPIDAGDFWGVGLEHWRLNPRKMEQLNQEPVKRSVNINFANWLDLVGMTQLNDTDLALFWRPRQPLPDDMIFTLNLTDQDGFDWHRETLIGQPGAYLYPPSRWPVGEIVMTRHQLPWQIGTPPGLYVAEIGLGESGAATGPGDSIIANTASDFTGWDIMDEQGRPRRRTALLESVNLSRLVQPNSGPLPMDQNPLIDLFPIIALRRTILPQETAQPGDRIPVALLWQAGEYNLDDVSIVFDLIDAQEQTHRVGSSFTPSRQFNLPRWDPGDMVLGQYWLDIPPETAPGMATLQLHIINVTAYPYDEIFPFGEIEILPTARNFTPPAAVDIPLEADFSSQISLIGVDCPANCSATPGQSITLTLYWRAETPTSTSYTVFTHLLDPKETVLINADHAPPKPTQGWVPGEIITDPVTLIIPPNLSPGSYAIEVGLYDAADPTFQRLPLTSGDTRLILPQSLGIE